MKRTLAAVWWINIIIVALSAMIIFGKMSTLPNLVPLFYSRPWGEEQLAEKVWLYLCPASALIISAVNYLLYLLIRKKGDKFLAAMVSGAALLYTILEAITVCKIIFLVS